MAFRDYLILDVVIRDKIEDLLPQKISNNRIIYLLRNDFSFQANSLNRPIITDFGLSVCRDKAFHNHSIQPNGFRASKVIIKANWDYSVDIWNLNVLVRLNRILFLNILTT